MQWLLVCSVLLTCIFLFNSQRNPTSIIINDNFSMETLRHREVGRLTQSHTAIGGWARIWHSSNLSSSPLCFSSNRASIVQKRIIYFQDEGSLTKKLCEQGKNCEWRRARWMAGGSFSTAVQWRELGDCAFWVSPSSASSHSTNF